MMVKAFWIFWGWLRSLKGVKRTVVMFLGFFSVLLLAGLGWN